MAAPVLAMGLTCPAENWSLVFVRGCFLCLLLAVLLMVSCRCSWGHSDNSHDHVLGLAGGQDVAAVLGRLELRSELESKEL